jgi:hypothetical protein
MCGRSAASPRRHYLPSLCIRSDPSREVDGPSVDVSTGSCQTWEVAGFSNGMPSLVSQETAQRSGDPQVRFDPLGGVELKGVTKPLPLYRAYRSS